MSWVDKFNDLQSNLDYEATDLTPYGLGSESADNPGFWDYAADMGKGVGLGAAGAIEGILELPTIFGANYDIPDNFGLGHADTTPGKFVEGFATFFLPS